MEYKDGKKDKTGMTYIVCVWVCKGDITYQVNWWTAHAFHHSLYHEAMVDTLSIHMQ